MKQNPSKPRKTSGHLPSAPSELKEAGRELWNQITGEFEVDDAGSKALLVEICRTADMIADCREQIAAEGLTIPTRNGSRDHPLIRTVLMSQSFLARSLLRLGIVDPPRNPVGRPVQGGVGISAEQRLRHVNGEN